MLVLVIEGLRYSGSPTRYRHMEYGDSSPFSSLEPRPPVRSPAFRRSSASYSCSALSGARTRNRRSAVFRFTPRVTAIWSTVIHHRFRLLNHARPVRSSTFRRSSASYSCSALAVLVLVIEGLRIQVHPRVTALWSTVIHHRFRLLNHARPFVVPPSGGLPHPTRAQL